MTILMAILRALSYIQVWLNPYHSMSVLPSLPPPSLPLPLSTATPHDQPEIPPEKHQEEYQCSEHKAASTVATGGDESSCRKQRIRETRTKESKNRRKDCSCSRLGEGVKTHRSRYINASSQLRVCVIFSPLVISSLGSLFILGF